MFGVLIPNQPVRVDFQQVSETELQLYIQNINDVQSIIVFNIQAPKLPENLAYSVYLQQGREDPVYLGQITEKAQSLSVGITHLLKNREVDSAGLIQISIERLNPVAPDLFNDKEKLALIGQRLAEDFG